jgi:hypothetical protein
VISHLESIGNSIIDQLKGSEYNHLKQQLLTSSLPIATTVSSNPSSLQLRKSLRQVLADLHAFDCYNQRQYRTVGIGDHDVNVNGSTTLEKTSPQTKNTNIFNDVSEGSKRKTRGTNLGSLSQTIENERKTPNIITRTICTRSSKLNTLNNNQEQINRSLLNFYCI